MLQINTVCGLWPLAAHHEGAQDLQHAMGGPFALQFLTMKRMSMTKGIL